MQSLIIHGFRVQSLRTWTREKSFQFATRYHQTTSNVAINNRYAAGSIHLDINLISENRELVISHLKARRYDSAKLNENIQEICDLKLKRSSLLVENDEAKHTRNLLSGRIGQLMKEKKMTEAEELKNQVHFANEISTRASIQLDETEQKLQEIFLYMPNLLDDRVPDGADDSENVIIHSWGDENRKMGENFRWHDDIANDLGGIHMAAASQISGTRFSILSGDIAKLERALVQYFLDFHSERGYEEVSVPYIVSKSALTNTGQLPKFIDDVFQVSHRVSNEDAFLIPTSEVPVTNMYRNQVILLNQLPIKHCCYSPCFRAEAGSNGRDTRGLLRQHQFHKVELVKITTPETSNLEHESMTVDVEELLKTLEIPFRRALLCSGDTGFSARICYDIEVWFPAQQKYREISSISNCYDFQSRRMMLRYKNSVSKKGTAYPHTLNGSGVAIGRALAAILENHQCPDGSVMIPSVLHKYMNGKTMLTPPKSSKTE